VTFRPPTRVVGLHCTTPTRVEQDLGEWRDARGGAGVARREGRRGEWRLARPDRLTLTATPGADSVLEPAPPNESRHRPTRAGIAQREPAQFPRHRAREDGVEVRTRRARIADVAKEAGVSKTAVSFAFNSPERLNAETAARIRAVAEGLGYRPRPVARMLTQKNTMTIGLLTPQVLSVVFANPFYATLCGGVAAVTDQAGYGLLFVSPLHGSLIRALGRATVDVSWPSASPKTTPRSNRSVAPASRWSSSTATHSRSTARSSRTTRSALDRPHAICSAWATASSWSSASSRRTCPASSSTLRARPKRSPRDA